MRRLHVVLAIAVIALLTGPQCSEDGPGEVISGCECPIGPDSVAVGTIATYQTDGATSSQGNELEYQFSWGDGVISDWSFEKSAEHSWLDIGPYEVVARARSSEHNDKVSAWSDAKEVQVGSGAPVPERPTGAGYACLGDTSCYSTEVGKLPSDKTLEIQFNWGADGLSPWSTALNGKHSWSVSGAYDVKARSRFAGYEEDVSDWSEGLEVVVGGETISAPEPPEGWLTVCPGETKTYCTKGAASSCNHELQHRFDWGDGRLSGWSSSMCASNSWQSVGSFSIRAQARCANTAVESPWSEPTVVTVGETVPAPDAPNGPPHLCIGDPGTYSSNEVSSSCVPDVEYQFDWGDGSVSQWLPSPRGEHTWLLGGQFDIRVRARSSLNPATVSLWSLAAPVVVGEEIIPVPITPSPTDERTVICPGEQRTLCTEPVTSSCGSAHPIEYQFDLGDGTLSQWSLSPCFTYQWSLVGTYSVRVQARCAVHTGFGSAWSLPVAITIQDEQISKPRVPSGPACACPDQMLTFSSGGAASSCGHTIEYAFDWGDGGVIEYRPDTITSHLWQNPGDYEVRVRARCATHKGVESEWSDVLIVTVGIDCENISEPSLLAGAAGGCPGEPLAFTTAGSVSSCGHDVEYRFDWDDGSYSNWTRSGNATHPWTSVGTYHVRSQARCVDHPTRESAWSAEVADVTIDETVSAPDTPSGPSSVCVGEMATYASGGSKSSCNHAVEYFFEWGDGDTDGPVASPAASHAWSLGGTYYVTVRAKCKDHDVLSDPSPIFTVHVYNPKYLEIGWDCAGGVLAGGNYPNSHMPEWSGTDVSYGRPNWAGCDVNSGACQAVFEPRTGDAVGELDDPDPGIAGVYIGADTREIKVTLTADFRHVAPSKRRIRVTVGSCLWTIEGSMICASYERTFRRADGCFSGSAVPVRLEVVDESGILPGDVAVSTLRLDLVGWCGN
jgi:hypothetical protein